MTPIMREILRQMRRPPHRRKFHDSADVLPLLSVPSRFIVDVSGIYPLAAKYWDESLASGTLSAETVNQINQPADVVWYELSVEKKLLALVTRTGDEDIRVVDNTTGVLRSVINDDKAVRHGYMVIKWFLESLSVDTTHTASAPSITRRQAAEKWKHLTHDHHVARLVIDGKSFDIRGYSGNELDTMPYHMVRGHWHHYNTNNGRIRKWVEPYWKGSREIGTVTKTYKI